jgi:hypothetical protein
MEVGLLHNFIRRSEAFSRGNIEIKTLNNFLLDYFYIIIIHGNILVSRTIIFYTHP